jgi:hypothetical protein
LKTALDVVAVAADSTLSDASDLNNLSEKLKQLAREAAAVLSASSGWLSEESFSPTKARTKPFRGSMITIL